MEDSLPAQGRSLPRSVAEVGALTLDRLASFRVIYIAIFAFVLLYVVSVAGARLVLDSYFRAAVAEAVRVSPADGPVLAQIQQRVGDLVQGSIWTRFAGVRVNVFVLGADGRTPLYLGGRTLPPPPSADPGAAAAAAQRLLPASADVLVSVPADSLLSAAIFVGYGAILVPGLFVYYRSLGRREQERLTQAMSARDTSAQRARAIQAELDEVRRRLGALEPSESAPVQAIQEREAEREGLRRKLNELAEREVELRASAARAGELEQEHLTLEELLEEAMEDVGHKEDEIRSLQDRLKRASKPAPRSGHTRSVEQLTRRMRTLYKNLEIDPRAIGDMLELGDETMRLKAEEGLKRLADDPETAAVRRKVGGLPAQLSIFELGFAGKGRIYYTRGQQQRYRVLAIGAKNTQKTDLEYLSRLPTA